MASLPLPNTRAYALSNRAGSSLTTKSLLRTGGFDRTGALYRAGVDFQRGVPSRRSRPLLPYCSSSSRRALDVLNDFVAGSKGAYLQEACRVKDLTKLTTLGLANGFTIAAAGYA